jgi:NAD(P)-dependent dehydrogenase (short-subunit alcohol dehydrogenase family)
MRVFLTGGTGYLGTAVADRLRQAGHSLTGLARRGRACSRTSSMARTPRVERCPLVAKDSGSAGDYGVAGSCFGSSFRIQSPLLMSGTKMFPSFTTAPQANVERGRTPKESAVRIQLISRP